MVDRHSGIYQETNGTGALAPHRTGTIPPAPSRMNTATVQNKCRHRTALFDHKHKVYLSPVVDCYDGMPVAWTIGTSPNAELANRMLRDACSTLGDGERPVIHSDRGCHYRWPGWISICRENGLTRSTGAKGCSPDNAAAEGFFGHLKQEFFHGRSFTGVTIEGFVEQLDGYMRWYRDERIKLAFGTSIAKRRRELGLMA